MQTVEKDIKILRPETKARNNRTEESPALSFAHLNFLFSVEDADHPAGSAYGFPLPQEEELYETGVLSRIFLKC